MKHLFACAAALATFGAAASAATITTYDRANFQAALSGGTISGQNFDSIPVGTILGTLDGVTYGASGGDPVVTNSFLTTTPPNGLGSTSLGYFVANESATFGFSTAITAFAIDINTFAPTAGDYIVTLNLGDVVQSKFDVFPGTATGQFVGFTSDVAFDSVTISAVVDPNTGFAYPYTLDSLVYGNASAVTVPEPSSLILSGIGGLAAFGLSRRRIRLATREAARLVRGPVDAV
jgi:hypothetical protein